MPMTPEPKSRWARSSQRGTGRGWEHVKYTPADGRKVPTECDHTQYLDTDTGSGINTGVCLDCGAHFAYRTWNIIPGTTPLTDAELQAHRDYFHGFWWNTSGSPEPALPYPSTFRVLPEHRPYL